MEDDVYLSELEEAIASIVDQCTAKEFVEWEESMVKWEETLWEQRVALDAQLHNLFW